MLTLPPRAKVFAAVGPTDMRKSFDGLVGIVEKELGQKVEDGHLFLFFNRRRDRLKVLYFTGDGLLILYRKLERGTFEMLRAPRRTDAVGGSRDGSQSSSAACLSLRVQELTLLLEGIELSSVKHRKWWRQDGS